jgi:multiple antibiotic resistance protein
MSGTARDPVRLGFIEDDTPGHPRPRPATRVWRAGLCLALLLVLAFGIVAPPERCPAVSAPQLRASAHAAVDWFVRNQRPDGTWLYLYDKDADSAPPQYNTVRHAGAVMGLYQAAQAGLPGALDSADRGADWALGKLVTRDDWAALADVDGVPTGATALLVAGLTLRREATGETRYDETLRRLGRFLVAQIEPSGAVLASYDRASASPVPGEYSKYYTGEAYWALTRLHRVFPGESWERAADRVGAYLATTRDEAEDHWPPIADHWAGYGLAETVALRDGDVPPLTEAEADYARRQAELFGGQARWVAQRSGPWGALVRPGGVLRGGGYGVIGEGLTGLWLAAVADPRLSDIRDQVGARAECVAAIALRRQSNAASAAGAADPARVTGAWFRNGETRMDDQQHALAGLLRTIPIVQATSRSDDGTAPSGWLWAAVVLLVLNPPRAAFAIPRGNRSRGQVARLGLLGGAFGGLGVCIAAALGEPLLGALDVSEPAFRIAAGGVAVLAGAFDLFRRPPAPEPALAGWRAALVPVAVPVVARPALVVIALGAGAEAGLAVTAAAIAIGVAALSILAARCPASGPAGRVLRWAGRLLATGLVACGVLLAIDGIFDL